MIDLFSIDSGDYDPSWPRFRRPSARAVIRRGDLWAMVYSRKYDYYKTPGGGIKPDETPEEALIREVAEETGLHVAAGSIRPLGQVIRRQADSFGKPLIFEQANLYYLADVTDDISAQQLDDYEADEGFTLRWVPLRTVIDVNDSHAHGSADAVMINRELRLAQLLLSQG